VKFLSSHVLQFFIMGTGISLILGLLTPTTRPERTRASILKYAAGLLGIGGGILQVPALVFLLRMPVHVATATAHYITAVNAGFTLIPLLFFGHADPKLTLCLGVGAVLGARLGARFSIKFRGDTLLRMLAAALVVAGFWMLR